MANPQHIQWLKEGVAAWNKRRERETFNPDFVGHDFGGRTLFETNRTRERDQWERVPLRGINLRHANLTHADLRVVDLCNADFLHANLTGASLSQTILVNTDLRHANLTGANFVNADLAGAKFGAARPCCRGGLSGPWGRRPRFPRCTPHCKPESAAERVALPGRGSTVFSSEKASQGAVSAGVPFSPLHQRL